MLHVPTVKECMHAPQQVLSPDTPIMDAIEALLKKGCPGAPVIDANRRVVGILTEKDCLRVLSNYAVYSLHNGTVGDYMSEMRVHLHPDMDIFGAANRFLATNFASLPVIDEGRLAGCVSRSDMLRGILKLEQVAYEDDNAFRRHQQMLNHPTDKKSIQNLIASETTEEAAYVLRHRHDRD